MILLAPAAPVAHVRATAPLTYDAIATFSYRYANVPFKRFETIASGAEIRYDHKNDQGGYDGRVVPRTTPVSGSLDDAVRAARELSRAHDVRPVIAVLAAGEGAWTLTPLLASFAQNGGETAQDTPGISDASNLYGPMFRIGTAKLTTEGLRVDALDSSLRAIVDDTTGLIRFNP